ncbi:MAG: hypothetical protein K0S61_308 [Anaerocolumna sp.]|jgi:hypothetical protein|nr:hypothetical protein [Anaerocolumna sp.]
MAVYDATSSWSGYQYQGKVAIYKVIKIINELLDSNKAADIGNYELEIEHLEDFSILKNRQYISAHQVKAYTTSRTMNAYLEAIINLNNNQNGIDYYLHVIEPINNWSDVGLKSTLNTKITNIDEKIADLTPDKVTERQIYEQERQIYENLLSISTNILNKVKLYEYEQSIFHCGLEDIKAAIIEQLDKYFRTTKQQEKTGVRALETVYINLIGKIDDHVRCRHLKKGSKRIYFSEIKDILDSDLLQRDSIYNVYLIKHNYQYKHKELFCKQCYTELKRDCRENGFSCYLIDLMDNIGDFSLLQFEDFIKKINPHLLLKDINDFNSDEYLQKSGIQSLFYVIMMVNRKYNLENEKLIYRSNNGAYLPTAISADGAFVNAEIEEYSKKICYNDSLLAELHESSVFITKNINKENIFDTLKDVDEVDAQLREYIEKIKTYEIFSNNVSLRDKDKAVEELNRCTIL